MHFIYCASLTSVSFPKCTKINASAFNKCYNLVSFYLPGSSLCTLGNSNVFTSTPIGGYSTSAGKYGSIFVPASLLTSYQNATNWTYFSSRIAAIESSSGSTWDKKCKYCGGSTVQIRDPDLGNIFECTSCGAYWYSDGTFAG